MVKINAVGLVRSIRDQIYKRTKSMTREELLAYYHSEAKKVHRKLGISLQKRSFKS